MKHALRQNYRIYRRYISGDGNNLKETTNCIPDLKNTSKESYFTNLGKRLNDPQTIKKKLKRFLNQIKIVEIPNLLVNKM